VTDVVLVGGAAEDPEIWADVLPLLGGTARVHELPGHGDVPGEPPTSVAAMADDVLRALGDEPVVLVGHSMGGAVALSAALAAPERVAGVVAVSTGARLPVSPALLDRLPDELEAVAAMVVALSTGGRDAVPPGREAVAERMRAMLRRGGGALLRSDLAARAGYDVRAALAGLDVPVIALVGTDDRMTPPRLAEELAAAPRSKVRVVPDAGHQLPWDAPDAVAAAVAELRPSAG
jgi:pimeloyl-ACP methyl ester carboxylesterase